MTQIKKEYLLEDLRRLGYEAYRGSSFSPEKRAQSVVEDHSNELAEDLAGMPEEHIERYAQNYKQKLSAYLSAMSRTYSPMISGPSNFPVRQMEKRNRTVQKRSEEFSEWRKRALAAIAKQVLENRSPKEKSDDKWKSIKKSILDSAAMIIAIDTKSEGGRGYSKPLFVTSITGLVKRIAQDGDVENLKRSLNYIKELNKLAIEKYDSPKPIVTDNNTIWKLEEVAVVAQETAVDQASWENEIELIGDIEIVKNYKIDRLQIVFPTKPNEEIRGKLKARAFRWSPTEGAWQRQLTGNAVEAAKQVLREVGILNETNDPEMLGRMAMHG